jgi:hypothetical protein
MFTNNRFNKNITLFFRTIAFASVLFSSTLQAQTKFEFYGEGYQKIQSQSKQISDPAFLSSYISNNSRDINLLLLKINHELPISKEIPIKVGFNTGLMIGNYATQNLAAEEPNFKNFYELNAYVKLNDEFKFEYGILPSHIGFESPIGKESWTATRSILADNSPYYEYGYRLNYVSKSEKIKANFNVIKGWQNISNPISGRYAIGHQITISEKNEYTINSSSYYGVSPNDPNNKRFLHNFYSQFHFGDHISWILGFDNGIEYQPDGQRLFYHTPVGIIRYSWDKNLHIAGRYEYFNDPHLILNIPSLYNVHGFSFNADYAINEQYTIRFENRWFVITENQNGVEKDFRSPFYPKLIFCAQIK